ncbi:hypothetical protein D3C80_2045070 [compost metagenome]
MRVRPAASPPSIRARWDIDLSPGIRTVPWRAPDLRAMAGFAIEPADISTFLKPAAGTIRRDARNDNGGAATFRRAA